MARRTTARDLNGESLNYDAEPEPNMRLSRAIAVVLLLHIVAIGGVLAFSLIKDRAPQPSSRVKPVVANPVVPPASSVVSNPVASLVTPKRNETPSPMLEKVLSASPTVTANPATRPVKTTTYVVRPGQTLARIASDNSVSLGALIAVNDTRITTANLKPGQEIQIPALTAPKDRGMDEATRLIETGAPPTPAKVMPASALAKATPAPVTAPAAAAAKTPTILAKATPPSMTVAKAIAVKPSEKIPTAKPAGKTTDQGEKTYVVVAGDNPNKLAKKFGISENMLLKANGIDDPRKLRIGQQLIIPARKAK